MNKNLITIMFCCLPLLAGAQNITFADATVKDICVHNWDTNNDGELSLYEAATVKDLGTVFQYRGDIKQFQELQYFTGLTSIGVAVFDQCSGLTSITIPEGVTSIGGVAFRDCSGLTSITIPKGVTSIGRAAFWNCSGLTSIVVEVGNTVYDSRDNSNAIIRTSDNELIVGCNDTVIPNSVTSLGYAAFAGRCDLTSIYLPNSVTRIGDWVFPGCSNLTSINIPNSLTSIGTQVFYGCTSLTSVTIPSSVTSIGELVFQYCDGLKEVRSMLKDPFAINVNCWEGINPDEITLYVPKGTKELYKAKEGWSVFKDIIEKEDAFFVDNAVYLNDTVARQGGKTTLSLKMKNTAAIRGFQFDLYLPEGVTVAKNSKGKILGALSAGRLPEDDEHDLTFSEQADGAIRFLCSSQYDETFTGSDGEIVTLQVTVAENIAGGNYPVLMKNVKLTETDIANFYVTEKVETTMSVLLKGDVTGDGFVNNADVTALVNFIIGRGTLVNEPAAYLNNDDKIDIADVAALIELIGK